MARLTTKRMRPVLSRDTIATAALRVTLDEPTTSLTLARIGAELGADPTALYRHYRSRDELLLDIADRVFIVPNKAFEADPDWRVSLRVFCSALRDEYLRRPALTAEVGARFTGGPNERRSMAILRDIVSNAGLDDEAALLQTRAVGSLIVSHSVMTSILIALPAAALDVDSAIAHDIHGDAAGADSREFETGSFRIILDTYIDGVTARARRPTGRAR
jgi:AcrR family transcriptional regulator